MRCEVLELAPAVRQIKFYEIVLSAGQQIERDKEAGRLSRQPLDATRSRMDSLKQSIERQVVFDRDHQLPVEQKAAFRQCDCGACNFGEISGEVLTGFRSQLGAPAVAIENTAEAVPLRLVLPSVAGRYLIDRSSLHRLDVHDRLHFRELSLAATCRAFAGIGRRRGEPRRPNVTAERDELQRKR